MQVTSVCRDCLGVSITDSELAVWECEHCGVPNYTQTELGAAKQEAFMLRKEVKRLREKLKGADRKIPFTVDSFLNGSWNRQYAEDVAGTIGTGYHGKGDPMTFTKPSNSMVDVAKDMHSKALSRQSKRLVKENQELKDVIVMLARKMHGQESYAELQSAIHDIAIKGKGE